MQSIYQTAYQSVADPEGLKLDQRHWLKKRDACKDTVCLAQAYRTRLEQLTAVLKAPKPCFRLLERKWPEVASGHYPVCVDFLNNLNGFCDEMPVTRWIKYAGGSDKILLPVNATPPASCDWQISPEAKTLKKPHWEAIDPKTHLKAIQNLYQHYYSDPEPKWQPLPPDRLERIDQGQSRLWQVWMDLDHDGQQEPVVRFDDLPCGRGEGPDFFGLPSQIGVLDERVGKIDARYEYLNNGFDIVVHDDKPYVLAGSSGVEMKFDSGQVGYRNSLELREPFSASTGEKGMRSVCVFDYIK